MIGPTRPTRPRPGGQYHGINRDGRYAPSPTGQLHLGNLRTGLAAWLLARSQRARFGMRIEDLDRERSRSSYVGDQLADLEAIGIDWDGELSFQSERLPLYDEALETLRAAGLIYECFCSRTEIRTAASAPQWDPGEMAGGAYPGTCARLSEAERAERVATGKPPALRVRAGATQVRFTDRFEGPQSGRVDDFVVRRGDGAHGYNLAVVVDDGDQGIGEVVRGDDLLDSTPRQIWLAERLGLSPIESWAHVPLVLGPDGKRLAKRHGDITLADRRALGESAADVRGLLAHSLGLCGAEERPTAAELLGRFDPRLLPSSAAPLPGVGR